MNIFGNRSIDHLKRPGFNLADVNE